MSLVDRKSWLCAMLRNIKYECEEALEAAERYEDPEQRKVVYFRVSQLFANIGLAIPRLVLEEKVVSPIARAPSAPPVEERTLEQFQTPQSEEVVEVPPEEDHVSKTVSG